jgi:hypothetical protein
MSGLGGWLRPSRQPHCVVSVGGLTASSRRVAVALCVVSVGGLSSMVSAGGCAHCVVSVGALARWSRRFAVHIVSSR